MTFKQISRRSAVRAGVAGVVVMTIVMLFFGVNIVAGLGAAAGAEGVGRYFLGGLIQLVLGVVYAFIYALFVEKWLRGLPRALSGALYSLFPFVIALLFFAPFMQSVKYLFQRAEMVKEIPYDHIRNKELRKQDHCGSCDGSRQKMPYCVQQEGSDEAMPETSETMESMEQRPHSGVVLALAYFFGSLAYGITLGMMYRGKGRA